eukprot:scaffold766_cov167-Ochromonas_danica.AAC.2
MRPSCERKRGSSISSSSGSGGGGGGSGSGGRRSLPSPGRPPLKTTYFFDENTTSTEGGCLEHSMINIERISSSSRQSTPTASPAHDLPVSLVSDSFSGTLSCSSTDSVHSFVLPSSSRQPVLAKRNPTIERMIQETAERSNGRNLSLHSPKPKPGYVIQTTDSNGISSNLMSQNTTTASTPSALPAGISSYAELDSQDLASRFMDMFPPLKSHRNSRLPSISCNRISAEDLQSQHIENSRRIAEVYGLTR